MVIVAIKWWKYRRVGEKEASSTVLLVWNTSTVLRDSAHQEEKEGVEKPPRQRL